MRRQSSSSRKGKKAALPTSSPSQADLQRERRQTQVRFFDNLPSSSQSGWQVRMARQPHGQPRIQPLRLGQRAGRAGEMEVLLEQGEEKQLREMSIRINRMIL